MASNSQTDHFEEPSVEIVVPKNKKNSILSIEDKNEFDSKESDHPNRPSDALWKQQKLPAWQPILTANTVLPAFFLLGIAFIPIGIGLVVSSNQVKEFSYDYTNCTSITNVSCSQILSKDKSKKRKCICEQKFTLDEDFTAPVFFYYGLSKYYQNHRRYVQSKYDSQLSGKVEDSYKSCDPYTNSKDEDNKPIAPCGSIANSLFNDTFKLSMINSNGTKILINLNQTNIAWTTDKDIKFKNPANGFSKYAKPLYWQKRVDDLDPTHPDNNGYKNEHFIVWMRTAAFPTFRKLWGRIDHEKTWTANLPKGNYIITIDYNYPVILETYNGQKRFIISNTSWTGGKNSFLGYTYIVVGLLCFLLWTLFLIIVKKFSQNPKEMVNISPKTPFQSTNYMSTEGS